MRILWTDKFKPTMQIKYFKALRITFIIATICISKIMNNIFRLVKRRYTPHQWHVLAISNFENYTSSAKNNFNKCKDYDIIFYILHLHRTVTVWKYNVGGKFCLVACIIWQIQCSSWSLQHKTIKFRLCLPRRYLDSRYRKCGQISWQTPVCIIYAK